MVRHKCSGVGRHEVSNNSSSAISVPAFNRLSSHCLPAAFVFFRVCRHCHRPTGNCSPLNVSSGVEPRQQPVGGIQHLGADHRVRPADKSAARGGIPPPPQRPRGRDQPPSLCPVKPGHRARPVRRCTRLSDPDPERDHAPRHANCEAESFAASVDPPAWCPRQDRVELMRSIDCSLVWLPAAVCNVTAPARRRMWKAWPAGVEPAVYRLLRDRVGDDLVNAVAQRAGGRKRHRAHVPYAVAAGRAVPRPWPRPGRRTVNGRRMPKVVARSGDLGGLIRHPTRPRLSTTPSRSGWTEARRQSGA